MTQVGNRSADPAFDFNSRAFLAFILLAGPVAWLLSLFVKFALVSNACLGANDFSSVRPQQGLYVIIDIIAIAVVALAAWFAYREARSTAAHSWDKFHNISNVGEARTHFLALWAILISALFISAIIFGLVADITVSSCTF